MYTQRGENQEWDNKDLNKPWFMYVRWTWFRPGYQILHNQKISNLRNVCSGMWELDRNRILLASDCVYFPIEAPNKSKKVILHIAIKAISRWETKKPLTYCCFKPRFLNLYETQLNPGVLGS